MHASPRQNLKPTRVTVSALPHLQVKFKLRGLEFHLKPLLHTFQMHPSVATAQAIVCG